jgi:hypothetical protein
VLRALAMGIVRGRATAEGSSELIGDRDAAKQKSSNEGNVIDTVCPNNVRNSGQ